jgi:hypothetical protein
MNDDYWEKLSFIHDGDDGEEDDGYRDKLYCLLHELISRIKKLESKSHIHKFMLPEHKQEWRDLTKKLEQD